jgi:hypothetical protein
MAQSAPATAQTIEAYVGETMDAARMGPIHWQVLALVASGRPKPCWVHRKDGIATKAPTRPAAWQSLHELGSRLLLPSPWPIVALLAVKTG